MDGQDGSRLRGPALEVLPEARSRKACVNCRRQKMKCRVDHGASSCRRCSRAGTECVFLPRANAASFEITVPRPATLPAASEAEGQSLNEQILWRLRRIEEHVGLPGINTTVAQSNTSQTPLRDGEEETFDDAVLRPLSDSIQALKSTCSEDANLKIWNQSLIKRLWSTFHDAMLGLHFLPRKQTFSSPTPIMLAAMLYCSSIRGAPADAELAPDYFSVLCIAISQLCVPSSIIGREPTEPKQSEEWAFQTILGILLAGLLREGISKETGIWISVAYRLILEHCPPSTGESSLEWQRLFTGLQIVDLEHASVHLSCPVVPIVAPFPCLRISPQDHIYRLSRMMHTGLTHFAGRGLPTIWSGLSSETPRITRPADSVAVSFSGVDAAVIRDWARQLDDWLVEFGARQDDPEGERRLAIRQYVLHRVLVLSVYLPARGSDLFSDSTPKEQHELLVSAREAVKLQLTDHSIWSNFDLVVITWAALIVIQGVEGGVGEPDDLENVNAHLAKLRESVAESSNVHSLLASRLEQKLQSLHTPVMGNEGGFQFDGEFDTSWFIFNQGSLQSGFDMLPYDNQI
ncbi:Zn(2)-C6 fungal-type domain-containing protein [Fusarium sp. LHS14.1]|nr:Zn(2)-C6 fungal-type domain-containing protein [Fusarium sp. LHS14.1]